MKNVKIADCTLQNGQYISDIVWGKNTIKEIIEHLTCSNVDIINVGFLCDEVRSDNLSMFDSLEQVNCLIKEKHETQYVITIEASNPFPIEKLEEADKNGVDVICVVIDEIRNIKDGLDFAAIKEKIDYCTKILKKGYSLQIKFARVDQYSGEEFIEVLRLFSELNPIMFCLEDSWGTQNSSEILRYMHLADKNLHSEINLGYHGHNNMMQVFDVVKDIISEVFTREIIIEGSICGIGENAGHLKLEHILSYLNEKLNRCYKEDSLMEVYHKCIESQFDKKTEDLGVYFLTAKYKCTPEYACYFLEHHVKEEELVEIIQSLAIEERQLFSIKKVNDALYRVRKGKNSLAIIVPICNQPEAAYCWVQSVGQELYVLGYDLIFLDSSSGRNGSSLKEFINQVNLPNVRSKEISTKQSESENRIILDELNKIIPYYDYVWMINSSKIPNINYISSFLHKGYRENADFMVVYPHYIEAQFYGENIYTDCVKLMKDFGGEMLYLGSMIFSKHTISELMKNYSVRENQSLGIELARMLFQYLSNHDFRGYYFAYNSFIYLNGRDASLYEEFNIDQQFIKQWNEMSDSLPAVYDEIREDVRKFRNWKVPVFDVNFISQKRITGEVNLLCLLKGWREWKKCTGKKIYKLFLLSLVPSFVIRFYERHKYNPVIAKIYAAARKIFSLLKRLMICIAQVVNSTIHVHKRAVPFSHLGYGEYVNAFDKDKEVPSYLLEGSKENVSEPFLSIVIPTNKRIDSLQDAIESVINQHPVDYEWEVVVVDNQPYDGKVNENQKYIQILNNKRILYYRNEKNIGAGGNMNRGVMLARGKWIAFLHDDDVLFLDYLQRIQKLIKTLEQKKRKAGFILTDMIYLDYDIIWKNILAKKQYLAWNYFVSTNENRYCMERISKWENTFTGDSGLRPPTCGCTYLREAYIEAGGIDEGRFRIEGDAALDYVLLKKYEGYRCLCPFGLYRWGDNVSSRIIKDIAIDLYDFREYLYRDNIFGRCFKGILRQEHTYWCYQSLGTLNMEESSKAFQYLLHYYPNPIRSFLLKILRGGYRKWQRMNRIEGECSTGENR